MRTRTFLVEKHEGFGMLGFRPSWIPMADPLTGMAVAHDLLEHGPNDDGSTEAELMALGAAMYVRGDGTGYFGRNGGIHVDEADNVSSDFRDIWSYHLHRDGRFSIREVRTRMDSELRERTAAVINQARKLVREEMEGERQPTRKDWDNMQRWLAKGYQKAVRRYANVIGGRCAVTYIFQQIEEAADKALKHADEGMEFKVTLNVKRAAVQTSLDYPREHY